MLGVGARVSRFAPSGAALELDVAEGSENDHGLAVHRMRRRAFLL
jgi:hypothetical protein